VRRPKVLETSVETRGSGNLCICVLHHRPMTTRRQSLQQGALPTVEPAFLDKPSAAAFLALSESTFEQLVRDGHAPRPRALSARRVGWLVRELREWAEARPVSDMLPPPNTGKRATRPS
jgi:prophage regulatory protein